MEITKRYSQLHKELQLQEYFYYLLKLQCFPKECLMAHLAEKIFQGHACQKVRKL